MRLAALQDAPDAFGSGIERERDQTADQWRDRVARCAWFVAAAGEEPCGLAAGRSGAATSGRDLISMWVAPRHRGQGIGGCLVSAVREWAVEDGGRELTLWVVDGNVAAMRTYARAGFAPTGRREPLPSNPALTKELWLLTLAR